MGVLIGNARQTLARGYFSFFFSRLLMPCSSKYFSTDFLRIPETLENSFLTADNVKQKLATRYPE
jgi:hypothetical protein